MEEDWGEVCQDMWDGFSANSHDQDRELKSEEEKATVEKQRRRGETLLHIIHCFVLIELVSPLVLHAVCNNKCVLCPS